MSRCGKSSGSLRLDNCQANTSNEATQLSKPNTGKARTRQVGVRATITDVAGEAGVSIKTVSRVINGEPNVRETTRGKVLAAIQTLDYQPNAAARGLSGRRSYVIGLVYENAEEFSYTKDVLSGALSACEQQGYSLLLRPVILPSDRLDRDIESFVRLTSADGLVLPAPLGDMTVVRELLSRLDVPVATISPKHPIDQGVNIFCDDAHAAFALTEYLIGQRHRRIAFVKGHPDHHATQQRLKGYKQALKQHAIGYDADIVRKGLFTFESGRQATLTLLNHQRPPSAIIASNDEMACGAMHAAGEFGIDIPGSLSIAGFDDTAVASRLWPPLTTVRQPIVGMAHAATSLLIQRLRGDAVQAPQKPFHCDIVIRRSTGVCDNS